MNTLVETVATFLTAFTGLLAAAVALSQVTATTRHRRAVDFWQSRIQVTDNEEDKLAFTVLQREELSKLVSTAWVRPRPRMLFHAYVWVTGIGGAAWFGYSVSTQQRLDSLMADGMFMMNIAASWILIIFVAEAYSEFFVFRLMRSKTRREFLRGEEPVSFGHPRGGVQTLYYMTGDGRTFLAMLAFSIATCGAAFTIAFTIFSEPDPSLVWIPMVAILITGATGFLGMELGGKYLMGLEPDPADFYPIHGDDQRAVAVEARIEQEVKEAISRQKARRRLRKTRKNPQLPTDSEHQPEQKP